jgi:cytochrome c oxidase cbb3-type subunit 3
MATQSGLRGPDGFVMSAGMSVTNLKPRRPRVGWLIGLGLGLAIAAFLICEHVVQAHLLRADPDAIAANAGLSRFAVGRGATIFQAHCATCHGDQGQGDPDRGVPSLRDQDWLYGEGKVSDIERVVDYGIRARTPKTWNMAVMPALATPNPGGEKGLQPLSPGDIDDVIDFLLQVEHRPHDPAGAARGEVIYQTRGACYDCHGADAGGDSAIGAPNLADGIWLYGDGSRAAIYQSIAHGRQGVCPAWIKILTPAQIREVAIYVHSLSQGRPVVKAR